MSTGEAAGAAVASRSSRVVAGFVWATALVWSLLAVTGVYLFFFYRPPTVAFDDIAALAESASLSNAIQTLHRVLSVVALFLSVGLFVVFVVQSRRRLAVSAGLLFAVTVFASFTGYLLPWDQLALRAVTVGREMRGFRPLFDDNVIFVLIGGVEVGITTLRRWLILHVVLVPLLALSVAAFAPGSHVRPRIRRKPQGRRVASPENQSPKPS